MQFMHKFNHQTAKYWLLAADSFPASLNLLCICKNPTVVYKSMITNGVMIDWHVINWHTCSIDEPWIHFFCNDRIRQLTKVFLHCVCYHFRVKWWQIDILHVSWNTFKMLISSRTTIYKYKHTELMISWQIFCINLKLPDYINLIVFDYRANLGELWPIKDHDINKAGYFCLIEHDKHV